MGSFISSAECIKSYHYPSPEDVFTVRGFLLAFVPLELANLIINEASYWPKATFSSEQENPLVIAAHLENPTVCCLVTPKISEILLDGAYKIKKICFKIVSHDQGWCDEDNFPGRYEGSYTWFEAVIVRDVIKHTTTLEPSDEIELIFQALDHRRSEGDNEYEVMTVKAVDDENSDTWTIQRNKRATGEFQLHTVVWTDEEEGAVDESIMMRETGRGLGRGFVRSLGKDHRIAVMARAQYPGWANHIKSIELEIHYFV